VSIEKLIPDSLKEDEDEKNVLCVCVIVCVCFTCVCVCTVYVPCVWHSTTPILLPLLLYKNPSLHYNIPVGVC
jgi:hypothetical protein